MMIEDVPLVLTDELVALCCLVKSHSTSGKEKSAATAHMTEDFFLYVSRGMLL